VAVGLIVAILVGDDSKDSVWPNASVITIGSAVGTGVEVGTTVGTIVGVGAVVAVGTEVAVASSLPEQPAIKQATTNIAIIKDPYKSLTTLNRALFIINLILNILESGSVDTTLWLVYTL
jgi:hypothetical protein